MLKRLTIAAYQRNKPFLGTICNNEKRTKNYQMQVPLDNASP
jgi:hypothetical protein